MLGPEYGLAGATTIPMMLQGAIIRGMTCMLPGMQVRLLLCSLCHITKASENLSAALEIRCMS